MGVGLFLILLLVNIKLINGDPFQCIDQGNNVTCSYENNYFYVFMNEEMDLPVDIATINCDSCTASKQPVLGDFEGSGNNILLGADFDYSDKWTLQITKRQDFENPNQKQYIFYIIFDEKSTKVIFTVKDINDNPPAIKVQNYACVIPENTLDEAEFVDCKYEIEDPDETGHVQNVKFSIDPPVYHEIFDVVIDTSSTIVQKKATAKIELLQKLDYEQISTYFFTLFATDEAGNKGNASMVIKVQDMNDQEPIWMNYFATKSVKEKTVESFDVYAKDGDTLGAEIGYEILNEKECVNVTIEKSQEKGLITVQYIDRDTAKLENDLMVCVINAYEIDTDEHLESNISITFIIEDVNDSPPIITPQLYEQQIKETDMGNLNQIFTINDIDIGANAQYTVQLASATRETAQCHEAFQIIPTNGYQKWEFSISIVDSSILDYEESPECRHFDFHIKSDDSVNQDKSTVRIQVKNMNNKVPYFPETGYSVKIDETIGKDKEIVTVQATDDDEDDYVTYRFSIDSLRNLYEIDENEGTIKTRENNIFDYEKQTVVIIQVVADDHLDDGTGTFHSVTTQITVNVQDINDETPKITLPNGSPEIEENLGAGTVVTDEIIARDPDGTADLEFHINWDKTWATKQGRRVDQVYFKDVVEINTDMDKATGQATATISVKEKKKLDYETIEVIYLSITVVDKEQVVNSDSDTVTLTISIIDMNDNAPIFDEDSITSVKRVDEHGVEGTLIATILAKDEDGPNYNDVTYSLKSIDDDISENLVVIDPKIGALKIGGPEEIDADIPKRYELNYLVIASDGENSNNATIKIEINDKNNKTPRLKEPLETDIKIKEETTNWLIQTIKGADDDRDSPNNNVSYYLNKLGNPQLEELFYVDKYTGEVWVKEDAKLDRDDGAAQHEIFLILEDNHGRQGESNKNDSISFTVIVTDINNKDPILQDVVIASLSENDQKNKAVSKIQAIDRDEPCTDNTNIQYAVVNVTDEMGDLVAKEIFKIDTVKENDIYCTYHGALKTAEPLKGFYGVYTVAIRATDKGGRYNEKFYDVTVDPYNFVDPSIIFPKDGDTLVIDEKQETNTYLVTLDGSYLHDFSATDNQKNKFTMSFEFVNDDGDSGPFQLRLKENNGAILQLKEKDSLKPEYTLTMRAFHNAKDGVAAKEAQVSFKVLFTNRDALPIFEESEVSLEFVENEAKVCKPIPSAHDPKCEQVTNCNFITYYHISRGNEEGNFTLEYDDKTKLEICVVKALDRENVPHHNLEVVATHDLNPPMAGMAPANAKPLKVNVEVSDVNDNPPVFEQHFYPHSLTASDILDKEIVLLKAIDPDSSDEGKLVYKIVQDTMTTSDSSLDKVKDNAFYIPDGPGANIIFNKFKPTRDMNGFFTFTVSVTDSATGEGPHEDRAEVKIYIISDNNRIVFTFRNNFEQIKDEQAYIQEVFTDELEYNCTIDDVEQKADDETGKPVANETDVTANFISSDNEPVEKSIIITKATKINIIQMLNSRFLERSLHFVDILRPPEVTKSMEDLLQTLLIVVSVVLGTLCIILFVAFIIRTRSLKARLEAMTTNVFGSTQSDLNRLGKSAPGTNKHAIEANPVWNEDLKTVDQYDTMSQNSGSSDLIGIEDNPEFEYNNRRDSVHPATHDEIRRKSLNPMAAAQTDVNANEFKPSLSDNSELF